MEIGYTEDEFWRKTPRQVFRVFEAEAVRVNQKYNERMHLAWHTAALMRYPPDKELPALKSLLAEDKPKPDGKSFDWRAHKAAMKRFIAAQPGRKKEA
jgi:hypothetical protein